MKPFFAFLVAALLAWCAPPASAVDISIGTLTVREGNSARLPITFSGVGANNISSFACYLTNSGIIGLPSVEPGAGQPNLGCFIDDFGGGTYRVTGFILTGASITNGETALLNFTITNGTVGGTYPVNFLTEPPFIAPAGPNPEVRAGVTSDLISSTGINGSVVVDNRPVIAIADAINRPNNLSAKVNVSFLLANDLVMNGTPTVISVSPTSAEGGTVALSGNWVFYSPSGNPATDSFSYTLSNGLGDTDTGIVVITIRPPDNFPSQNIISFSGAAGNFTVNFAGIPGRQYRFQYATNVTGPWTDIQTVTAGNNGLFSVTDTTDRGTQAYYRTIAP